MGHNYLLLLLAMPCSTSGKQTINMRMMKADALLNALLNLWGRLSTLCGQTWRFIYLWLHQLSIASTLRI
jgi:hypothetical protein